LGWTTDITPEKIEQDLIRLFPRQVWDPLSHTLIFQGRRVCTAAKPACAACAVNSDCPNAFNAEKVGRKPTRVRAAKSAAPARPAAKTGKLPANKAPAKRG
jgi:endonuclease-3